MKKMTQTIDKQFPSGTLVQVILDEIFGFALETHGEISLPKGTRLTIVSMIQSYSTMCNYNAGFFNVSRRALWVGGLIDVSTYGLQKI